VVYHAGTPSLTDEIERRMALEERIDNVGKKPKAVRRKKKGDDDVDVSGLLRTMTLRASRAFVVSDEDLRSLTHTTTKFVYDFGSG